MGKQWFGAVTAVIVMTAGLVTGASIIGAQDDATPASGEPVASHPAHIHSGTCDDLGDIVHPLENVTSEPVDIEATPAGTPMPSEQGLPGDVVARSISTLEVGLQDLVDGDYAVNVHQSEDDISTFIACGNIEGEIEDDSLSIELQELNDSGITGQATMTDHGDGTIGVTVTLTDRSAEALATPAATPEG